MGTAAPMHMSMARQPMNTEAVLTLGQWLSPAYPVGAFAYSHGLERLAEASLVDDGETLESWLRDVIEHGAGRADVLFLAAAYRAETAAGIDRIDARARAFAASSERLLENVQMGAAFAGVTASVWGIPLARMTYPVALGCAARAEDLPLELTAQLYLQAFMANLAGAAQRLLPLGQTAAQALIRRLTPVCANVAQDALSDAMDNLSSTIFLSDIMSMQHEIQETRIFRT